MSEVSKETLLDKIVGHEAVRAELLQLVRSKAVPHALLFAGPAGVGKRTIARAFAACLLSSSDRLAETSRLLEKGSHPDFHAVTRETGKKDISVESIRTLCSSLQLKPYYAHSSVAVINNAHEMNLSASNALLTTLEEPNAENYLILVSDAPQRLPETIVSRCQLFNFGELGNIACKEVLTRVFSGVLDAELLERLSRTLTGGSLAPLQLDAHLDPRTLQPIDLKQLKNHLEQLLEERERVRAKLNILFSERESLLPGDAVALASDLAADKDSGPIVWELLSEGIRDRLRSAGPQRSSAWAQLLLDALESQKLSHERSLNPQLQFASLCLKIADCRSR